MRDSAPTAIAPRMPETALATEKQSGKTPRAAVGFCITLNAAPSESHSAWRARKRCLRHFPWLSEGTVSHGEASVAIWTHHAPEDAIHTREDGCLFVLCGSPMNRVTWRDALERLAEQGDNRYELPWEGRCVLIRISPDGRDWTIWSDWVGALPVFHASLREGAVASSIEPIVVEAAGLGSREMSRRGIVEMLVHGHFLGTDTLYERMHTLPADSVSCWQNGRFTGSAMLWTVEPSDSRWDRGWEELVEEMYHQTYRAISSALRQDDRWILPLSGGMDSRLIACVGADEGVNLQAYTYGPAAWSEPIYARQVADALETPWQRVDVGVDYLSDYTPMWFDWFGSSLHAHGMYQMPFLLSCIGQPGVIPDGFYGNNLAGGDHPSAGLLSREHEGWQAFRNGYFTHWRPSELTALVSFDPAPALEEMADIVEMQLSRVEHWPFYHQRNAIDMWNRQQRFTFYQPMMYDYFKGAASPFMDRTYARFCMSLPRLALEGRRLQREMLERYWPQVAEIGATFCPIFPQKLTKRWLLRAGAASVLPARLRLGPLREFAPAPNTMEIDCTRAHGWEALHPLSPQLDGGDILNAELIVATANRAIRDYDTVAYNKIRALQALVWRLGTVTFGDCPCPER